MSLHNIEPVRRNLHGHYSPELEPVLEIQSGDTVSYRTLDAGWGLIEQENPFVKPKKFEPRNRQTDWGHALLGPIAIQGAKPGMTLEIRINHILPGRWGWSCAGGYPSALNDRLGVAEGPECETRWSLDPEAGLARSQQGRTIRLRPFMGNLGMPPVDPGVHSTFPPRVSGGNIDCKELVSGSVLFLPIPVEGGLFSVGDGHAVQGDGEVSGPALECPMEQVELEFHLHKGLTLTAPRANTPVGWITFGLHQDMNEAWVMALDSMLNLMSEQMGIERKEALMLSSLVVDLRVTQVVNGVVGVHAVLPHGAVGA